MNCPRICSERRCHQVFVQREPRVLARRLSAISNVQFSTNISYLWTIRMTTTPTYPAYLAIASFSSVAPTILLPSQFWLCFQDVVQRFPLLTHNHVCCFAVSPRNDSNTTAISNGPRASTLGRIINVFV